MLPASYCSVCFQVNGDFIPLYYKNNEKTNSDEYEDKEVSILCHARVLCLAEHNTTIWLLYDLWLIG